MYATHSYARRNKLVLTAPRDRNPVSARRPGDGMLADEAFSARPSLAARYAEAALMPICLVIVTRHSFPDSFQIRTTPVLALGTAWAAFVKVHGVNGSLPVAATLSNILRELIRLMRTSLTEFPLTLSLAYSQTRSNG